MLIFIFFTSILTTISCPQPRDNLIQCFRELLDTNKDSILTISEIDNFLNSQTCINNQISTHLSGKLIMNTCDLNKDGVLTLSDWVLPNSCVTNQNRVELICTLCKRCGWNTMKK